MNQTTSDQASAGGVSHLTLAVSFSFETSWSIGPVGDLNFFPPGGDLATNRSDIGPVELAGLTDAQVAQVVRQRAGDMALIAEAIAAANVQFAKALAVRP